MLFSLRRLSMLVLLWLFTFMAAQAQKVQVQLAWQGKPIVLPYATTMAGGGSLKLAVVKLYMHYQQQGQWVHQLLDFEDQSLVQLPIRFEQDSMVIYLGTAKALDSRGVQSGPLDPSQGMYWTWLTGYIQAKIEGTSSAVASSKHKFEYHLGYRQDQTYALPQWVLNRQQGDQVLNLDMACWFQDLNLGALPKVVDPGTMATQLMQNLAKCAVINQDP